MKHKANGFTIVELLTVLAIITILVALLIPSLRMVRTMAKETEQRAQFATLSLAIDAFRSDYGDYPPSSAKDNPLEIDYCGAQKLAEALLGWDLLGFHPDSDFRSDGKNDDDTEDIYPQTPPDPTNADDLKNLRQRKGPYLELATAKTFKLESATGKQDGLYANANVGEFLSDRYVLCDVFSVKKVTVTSGNKTVTAKAGTPILYYKAHPFRKDHATSGKYDERIYDVHDNKFLVDLTPLPFPATSTKKHPLEDSNLQYEAFYDFILDPKAAVTNGWPYRPDSYILISAGPDGLYGTPDDITNFDD